MVSYHDDGNNDRDDDDHDDHANGDYDGFQILI